MNRRQFLAAAPALVGAASCSKMKTLNIQPLGIVEGGQFGLIRSDQVTNPQIYTYTVPADMAFELWTASFQFTASATVANRLPFISVTAGADVTWSKFVTNPVTAGGTLRLWFGVEIAETAVVNGNIWLSIPRLVAPPLSVISLSATSLQLGDITSAICMTGRFWPLTR